MKKPVQVFSYNITNAGNRKGVIHIDGDIVDASTQAMIKAIFGDTTTTSYKSFRNQVDQLDAQELDVIINSSGGHVGDALAMYDYLQEIQAKGVKVNTKGIGIVASSATLLLLAGKSPEMSANSWFMMHEVSGGAYGTVTQVENYAATMRQFNNKLRDLYAQKSGQRPEEVTKLMNKDTWLTAQAAKDKGLIATVTGDAAFENKIEEENWMFEDTTALVAYNNSVKPISSQNQFEDMKQFFAQWGKDLMNAIKGLKPAADATNETVVNSIADAINTSFTAMADQFETGIQAAVDTAMKGEAGKKVITDFLASEAGQKPIKDFLTGAAGQKVITDFLNTEAGKKIISDSDAVKEIEAEVVASIGEKSKDTKTVIKNQKPVGSFTS